MDSKNIEKWSSLKEVSEYLGASRESIFKWIEHKGMPAHKLGKLWKFKLSEVDEWIRSGHAGVRDGETGLPVTAKPNVRR